MRIVVISDEARPLHAPWQAALRLAAAWRAAGHDAEVWALRGDRRGHAALPVRRVARRRAVLALRQSHADVVVSTSTRTARLALAHAPAKARVVHWARTPDPAAFAGRRRPDLMVASDAPTGRTLAAALPGSDVVVITDPVAAGAPRASGDARVVLAAGELAAGSGLRDLVAAFAGVAERLPGWRLRILGDGPDRAVLGAMVRSAGLCDRVELPGPSQEMPLEWARAGIAVAVRRGGPTLDVTDAMAAGLPVVARDGLGARERITHGVDGVLVPSSPIETWGETLVALADDPERRARLGAAARVKAESWAPETVAARWIAAVRGDRADAVAPDAPDAPAASVQASAETSADTFSGSGALHDLLGTVLDKARSADPAAFVLRPVAGRRTVVALDASAREAFLDELAAADEDLLLSEAPSGVETGSRPLASGVALARRGVSPVLAVATSDGAAELQVELWREVDGTLRPPRENEWVDRVPLGRTAGDRADIEVAGLTVPTLPIAAVPTVFDRVPAMTERIGTGPHPSYAAPVDPGGAEPAFPIDVVYTWVDGGDPAWQARRDAALAAQRGATPSPGSSGKARFTNRDELRYSLRSVRAHAPWVRRIFLVTADQVPAWLAQEHPDITVVSHRDILPADVLPVFNSHAIETGLHRIEGLSEQFLYLNDDVLLGRAVRPSQFFTAAGEACAFVGWQTIGFDEATAEPYQRAALNNRRLLQERFGVTSTRVMRHTPHPMRRSVLAALEQEWPAELRRTAEAKFRSSTDLSVASSLAQHYGLLTGAAVPAGIRLTFVSLTEPQVAQSLRQLLARRDRDVICLGDHHDWGWPETLVTRLLHGFLKAYYPERAPWEKPGS